MLQIVNLANYSSEVETLYNNTDQLQIFLNFHQLDGLEMMLCAPWNRHVHKPEWIQGVHLRFWPCWLEFWRGEQAQLLRQFGSEQKIKDFYGALTREAWLNIYRENIRAATQTGAKYLVFHVSHTQLAEVFTWQFRTSDREVIEASIEVINELAAEIPEGVALLFENLWWPGLTLKDRELTALLLDNVKHRNVGIMLDTGHLMNTNQELKTETEGVDYILTLLSNLGEYRHYIKGIHLHQSLSGEYVKGSKVNPIPDYTMQDLMKHVMKIDQHQPFSTPEVQRIIDYVQPDYLVHEFLQNSWDDWGKKIRQQQQALNFRGKK
ncbi:MAG TPA: TIM barrel protein [Negativicutes bacterium]